MGKLRLNSAQLIPGSHALQLIAGVMEKNKPVNARRAHKPFLAFDLYWE